MKLRVGWVVLLLSLEALVAGAKERWITVPAPAVPAIHASVGGTRFFIERVTDCRRDLPAENIGFYLRVVGGDLHPLLDRQGAAGLLEGYLKEGLRANALLAERPEGAVRLAVDLHGLSYRERIFGEDIFGSGEVVCVVRFTPPEGGPERQLLIRALHVRGAGNPIKFVEQIMSLALRQAGERLLRSKTLDGFLAPADRGRYVGPIQVAAGLKGWLERVAVYSPSLGPMSVETPDLSGFDVLHIGPVKLGGVSRPEKATLWEEELTRELYLRMMAEVSAHFETVTVAPQEPAPRSAELDVELESFAPMRGGVKMTVGILFGMGMARAVGNGNASGTLVLRDASDRRVLARVPFAAEQTLDVTASLGAQIASHAARLLLASRPPAKESRVEVSCAPG